MRLVEVKLTNFRAYRSEAAVALDGLTVLVGKNDAGKSSILDALDVFFNEAEIEGADCCVHSEEMDIHIVCVFDNLPTQIIIDEQHPTSLTAEHLLRADGKLEIRKVYNCAGTKGKLTSTTALAFHPSGPGLNDLLGLKINELKARAQQSGVDLSGVNQTTKAQLRAAIWDASSGLECSERQISLSKEGGKEIWDQLQQHLPIYAIFKSDRSSTDQDAEAQDPLRSAIKEAIRRREAELGTVLSDIRLELDRVARRTVEKIREMSEDLANQLHPTVKNKNWESLFNVSLTGENDIPINKRGSGTRRLILLNFFRAKAEETSEIANTGVIYAIEEPETSQHPNHQIMLLNALETLIEESQCQIVLTTHTPTLARRVNRAALRLISSSSTGPVIEHGSADQTISKIKSTLGVLPDHDVRAFLGVEGKNDISFLKRISAILAVTETDIPDLSSAEQSGRLVFLSLGGSNMDAWINTMENFGRPEFYLTDRDAPPPQRPKYHNFLSQWEARGCKAWVTSKKELENYICPSILRAIQPAYTGTGLDFEDVPMLFAEAVHTAAPNVSPWMTLCEEKKKQKESSAKKFLNTVAVSSMTPDLLTQTDIGGDIRGWLREVGLALL